MSGHILEHEVSIEIQGNILAHFLSHIDREGSDSLRGLNHEFDILEGLYRNEGPQIIAGVFNNAVIYKR